MTQAVTQKVTQAAPGVILLFQQAVRVDDG
jgi:hypothetical protein